MNARPLVSVVMPAYNAEGTIARAVQSVLDQTISDLELIVCEDASTDATFRVASSFADSRVRVIRNEVNLGEGRSRDRAISCSLGKWIAVIDADDAWHPDRLRRLLAATGGESEVAVFDDILICRHLERNGDLSPWRPIRGTKAFGAKNLNPTPVALEEYIQSDRLLIKPLIPTTFLHRNLIKHSSRSFGADSEFFIKLGLAGLAFKYLPEPLYLYRVSPLSATARSRKPQMREMLQEIRACSDLPESIRIALDNKISKLHSDEYVFLAAEKVIAGDILGAVRMFVTRPGHFASSSTKILNAMRYRLHRLWL